MVEYIGGFKSPNILSPTDQIGPSEKDVYNALAPKCPNAPNSGESSDKNRDLTNHIIKDIKTKSFNIKYKFARFVGCFQNSFNAS